MELIRIPNLLQHYYYRQTQTWSLGPRVSKRKKTIFPIGKKGIKFFSGKIKNKRKFCVYLITQADIKQSTRFQYDVIKFNQLIFFCLEPFVI